jgi:ribosome assembly protein YihI (activator of Der GTPase)
LWCIFDLQSGNKREEKKEKKRKNGKEDHMGQANGKETANGTSEEERDERVESEDDISVVLEEEEEDDDYPCRLALSDRFFISSLSIESDLRSLAKDSLSPTLQLADVNIWKLIVGYLDSKSLRISSYVSKLFYVLCQDDQNWERLFAQRDGAVYLCPRRCASWKERFFMAQRMDVSHGFCEIVDVCEVGDEVLLCPGVYDTTGAEAYVLKEVHIIGCGFNRNFEADYDFNACDVIDVHQYKDLPNIRIFSSEYNVRKGNYYIYFFYIFFFIGRYLEGENGQYFQLRYRVCFGKSSRKEGVDCFVTKTFLCRKIRMSFTFR